MRRSVHKACESDWRIKWNELPVGLRLFKPDLNITAYSHQPRYIQMPITRIRQNATQLNKGHYITKSPHEKFDLCNFILSLSHIQLICPKFKSQRQTILDHCTKIKVIPSLCVIISLPFPPELIYKYLCDINYGTRI